MTPRGATGELDRSQRPKGKGALGASLAFALLVVTSGARATPGDVAREVDLPLAGLRVTLELPPDATTSVRSRWDAKSAEDVLTVQRPGAPETRYTIEIAGRTARDCPLVDPFPLEIGGETWIRGTRGADSPRLVLCRTFIDARVVVGIAPEPELADATALERHTGVLRPLLDAIRVRRVIPGKPLPLPPPDAPLAPELVLPTVGLVMARPDDGMSWRVAAAADREFDALIRVLPVFPEVQVAVRRHARGEVPGCARLVRHLLNTLWSASEATPPEGWDGVLGKRIGRFQSFAICRETDTALLDVRVASRPLVPLATFDALVQSIAQSRALISPPPSKLPRAATRAVLIKHAALALGLDFPGTVRRGARAPARLDDALPYGSIELGMAWMSRNGPELAAALSFGADGYGALVGASVELGVALALDEEMTLVLGLALEERKEALFQNRSLSFALEMRSSHHLPGRFVWALRVVPLQLASREPAITGLPLSFGWTGIFPNGLLVGADLRWITSPLIASEAWPSEGVSFGLRIGYGTLCR